MIWRWLLWRPRCNKGVTFQYFSLGVTHGHMEVSLLLSETTVRTYALGVRELSPVRHASALAYPSPWASRSASVSLVVNSCRGYETLARLTSAQLLE